MSQVNGISLHVEEQGTRAHGAQPSTLCCQKLADLGALAHPSEAIIHSELLTSTNNRVNRYRLQRIHSIGE